MYLNNPLLHFSRIVGVKLKKKKCYDYDQKLMIFLEELKLDSLHLLQFLPIHEVLLEDLLYVLENVMRI